MSSFLNFDPGSFFVVFLIIAAILIPVAKQLGKLLPPSALVVPILSLVLAIPLFLYAIESAKEKRDDISQGVLASLGDSKIVDFATTSDKEKVVKFDFIGVNILLSCRNVLSGSCKEYAYNLKDEIRSAYLADIQMRKANDDKKEGFKLYMLADELTKEK